MCPRLAVNFQMRIRDLGSGEIKKAIGPASTEKFAQKGNMVIPVGVWLPIQDLPSGNYRLEVQAFDSEGQQTQWQPSGFKIE